MGVAGAAGAAAGGPFLSNKAGRRRRPRVAPGGMWGRRPRPPRPTYLRLWGASRRPQTGKKSRLRRRARRAAFRLPALAQSTNRAVFFGFFCENFRKKNAKETRPRIGPKRKYRRPPQKKRGGGARQNTKNRQGERAKTLRFCPRAWRWRRRGKNRENAFAPPPRTRQKRVFAPSRSGSGDGKKSRRKNGALPAKNLGKRALPPPALVAPGARKNAKKNAFFLRRWRSS